jgi:SAM-dependent methyltransferase
MLSSIARQWVLPFVDPRRAALVARLPAFLREWREFRRQAGPAAARAEDLWPCLDDRVGYTPFDPHYFYQAAWLARAVAQARPRLHVDVGSSVTAMAVLSAQVDLVFADYRPLRARLAGLSCVAGDITRLPFPSKSVRSLSSLHVIEHIGLGRYGDPIDPTGSSKALRELQRIVADGGRLYLSTPVGRERVCFNAHRVFAPRTIVAALAGLTLVRFSYVGDDRELHADSPTEEAAALDYGCGLFEFVRQ